MEIKKIEQKACIIALKNNKYVDDLMIELTADYFSDYWASQIYEWIEQRYSKGQNIGLATCTTELDLPEKVFQQELLIESEFDSYIQQIKNAHQKRKIKQAMNELDKLISENSKTADEFRTEAQEIIFQHTDSSGGRDQLIELDDALAEAYDSLVRQDEKDKAGQGLATGFPGLDGRIGGLEPGHLTVIAGQTSMGKTAFALNVVHNVIRQDKKALFFSLEMTAKEIADRLIIRDAKVDASKYQKKLDDPGWQNVNAALNRLTGKPLLISEKRGLGVSEIRAKAMKADRQNNLDLIVIDYLQMIRHTGSDNIALRVGDTVTQLRTLAGDLKVPIILLSQLNRKVDGRPSISHLRNSGMIEEVADEVWLLWRPKYEEEKKRQEPITRQEAELILGKGRTKGTGYVPLWWYPKLQTFRDDIVEENEGTLYQQEGVN